MKQKKSLKILIAIVLLIIFVAFVIIDRIIIIRIRYDEGSFDGHYVDYPNDERLYILKGLRTISLYWLQDECEKWASFSGIEYI